MSNDEPERSTRILLADDHTLVRAGFKALLEDFPEFVVVAEASDASRVPALIASHHPDVVVLDIAMPGNGLETAEKVAREFPDVKIIMLSMYANEEYIRRALQAGASAYLVKSSAPAEFELAIRAVIRGETYLSPAVSTHVVADYIRRTEGENRLTQLLTERQVEVLTAIARGLNTKSIAHELGISVKTVETHRAQLMHRLDIHDVAGLTRCALRSGLIAPEM